MKKFTAVFLALLMLAAAGCARKKTYRNDELGLSFELPAGEDVTDSGGILIFDLDEKIRAVIIVEDATPFIGADFASSNPTDDLDLTGGAFDTNYNNPVYDRQFFEYILSGSERSYSVGGITQAEFAGYAAITAGFTSERDDVNGYMYLLIEHNLCYVICIYVEDAVTQLHNYGQQLDDFEDSFTIFTEEK